MIYGFGPRARRVYAVLRDRIARGDWLPGERLPSHRELATELGVAPLTVRQVLAQLEEEGLVSRQVGRGTFVREATSPTILVVAATSAAASTAAATMSAFLAEYVRRAGYRALIANAPAEAHAILARDPAIVLALCDAEGPPPAGGVEAIRTLRARWPDLPVAAIVGDPDDLRPLFGTAEWPLHVLPKPVNLGLLDELLRLVARQSPPAGAARDQE